MRVTGNGQWARLIAVGALAACRSGDDPRVAIEQLADRRVARAEVWEPYLARGDATVRAFAAREAGRVRDRVLAAAVRRALAVESSDAVRAEQLFALGQLGDAESLDVALRQLDADAPRVRAAAAEAVGKLGVVGAAPNLVAHLSDVAPEVRGAALLALARLTGWRAKQTEKLEGEAATQFLHGAAALLADADPGVRWKAAYALAQIDADGRLEPLRAAARAGDAPVRFFGTAGLGRLAKNDKTLEWNDFLPRLEDPDPFVAASASSGLAQLGAFDSALDIANAAKRTRAPSDFHVRTAALAALGSMVVAHQATPEFSSEMTGEPIRCAMDRAVALSADPSLTVRSEAMKTIVRIASFRWAENANSVEGIGKLASAPGDVHARVAAIRALAVAPAERRFDLLATLARDPSSYVASEALTGLAGVPASEPLRQLAREASSSRDLAIAGSGLDLLKEVGTAEDVAIATAAFDRLSGSDNVEARSSAVQAAAALGGATAGKAPKKEFVDFLRRALADESPTIVAAVRTEWARLKLPSDPVTPRAQEGRPGAEGDGGGKPSSIELEPGVDFLSSAPNPWLVLHFKKGDVTIELLREEAPRHVKMMVTRARAGLCDGLPIHRVVSGFVVQGLDPRGDGWGSGGVFLRDEINRVPFERGAVGMPNAGPDSAGCQLFVMLMPAPHLDGRYTVFGRVVAGMEVVDALDLGDVCIRAEVSAR